MTLEELGAIVRGITPVVREMIAAECQQALVGLVARVVAVETREVPTLDVAALRADLLAAIPVPQDGRDGKDADPNEIINAVVRTLADWPKPSNGRDGVDGRSVDPDDLVPLIAQEVTKALERWPQPKDGVGLAGALIDRDGQLTVTLTDGTVRTLGLVVGRDPDPAAIKAYLDEALAALPKPQDGRDAIVGQLRATYDGERTLSLLWPDGATVEGGRVTLPVPIYRGVYAAGQAYQQGDTVTYGGSVWIARTATSEKPGDAGTAWQLAVKTGREGKPGRDGIPGPMGLKGDKGDPGRNYT